MTSPSTTSSSTSSTETSDTSTSANTNRKSAPTRPALSLILPGSQTLTPPDSRSPSHSHLRSSSYTIGQNQAHFAPKSQSQRTISETLHTRNTTVPSIITTPVSPTDGDRSPGDTRRSRSNTSDGPKPAATASARPRGPSLSALQAVTRQTPLNSHPRTPESTTATATADSPPETADEPEQAGPAPTAVNTENQVNSDPVKPESSENPRTTTKQAPPLPSDSRQPTPEQETMTPVADLLRFRPSQVFSDNTTTGGTNYSPYQNASAQPRSSVAVPAAVRSSMPEPPTQSHVQIRNSRLSFTNLKSNLSLNTLLQSQPSGYQASPPTAPSQSSASTTSASTAPSTFSPQPQTAPTPLSPPPQSTPAQPQFQPPNPNPNPDPNPHDASSLLALTHHVHTQTSQARHLFTQLQHYLPFVEKQWIQSTIGDTEAAARDILLLTESMRIDQETNNGKLGLKTQFRWMMRDSRRARERRERLVLCHASLVAVLVRLEGVRAKVPQTGLSGPSFVNPGNGAGAGVGPVPAAPVEISASSPALQTEFEHDLPIRKSPPPPKKPLTTEPTATAATAEVNANTTTNSQAYPPPPTAAPPPIPVPVPVQNNNKPDSPIWDLPTQLQDADKELVVQHDQPPPIPPKVKIEEDANPTSTATATAAGNGAANSNPANGSIVSCAGTETETETETATTTATGTPRTMSPVSPEGPTKLDNELLDMLEWRWKQGRAA